MLFESLTLILSLGLIAHIFVLPIFGDKRTSRESKKRHASTTQRNVTHPSSNSRLSRNIHNNKTLQKESKSSVLKHAENTHIDSVNTSTAPPKRNPIHSQESLGYIQCNVPDIQTNKVKQSSGRNHQVYPEEREIGREKGDDVLEKLHDIESWAHKHRKRIHAMGSFKNRNNDRQEEESNIKGMTARKKHDPVHDQQKTKKDWNESNDVHSASHPIDSSTTITPNTLVSDERDIVNPIVNVDAKEDDFQKQEVKEVTIEEKEKGNDCNDEAVKATSADIEANTHNIYNDHSVRNLTNTNPNTRRNNNTLIGNRFYNDLILKRNQSNIVPTSSDVGVYGARNNKQILGSIQSKTLGSTNNNHGNRLNTQQLSTIGHQNRTIHNLLHKGDNHASARINNITNIGGGGGATRSLVNPQYNYTANKLNTTTSVRVARPTRFFNRFNIS